MSNDLVKRLTILVSDTDTELLAIEAADRIEQLEAALREIAQHDIQAIAVECLRRSEREEMGDKLQDALQKIAVHDMQAIAIDALNPGTRAALEGEKDD